MGASATIESQDRCVNLPAVTSEWVLCIVCQRIPAPSAHQGHRLNVLATLPALSHDTNSSTIVTCPYLPTELLKLEFLLQDSNLGGEGGEIKANTFK